MFDPNKIVVSGGAYCENFYRGDEKLNVTVIYAGLKFYERQFLQKHCAHCKCRIDLRYKAWLVNEDLKKVHWKFKPNVFIQDGVSAIMMYDLRFS